MEYKVVLELQDTGRRTTQLFELEFKELSDATQCVEMYERVMPKYMKKRNYDLLEIKLIKRTAELCPFLKLQKVLRGSGKTTLWDVVSSTCDV